VRDMLLDKRKRVLPNMCHYITNGFLDHIPVGQAYRVRFGEILFDSQILLRRTLIGPNL
jgi:hypothetical protein